MSLLFLILVHFAILEFCKSILTCGCHADLPRLFDLPGHSFLVMILLGEVPSPPPPPAPPPPPRPGRTEDGGARTLPATRPANGLEDITDERNDWPGLLPDAVGMFQLIA